MPTRCIKRTPKGGPLTTSSNVSFGWPVSRRQLSQDGCLVQLAASRIEILSGLSASNRPILDDGLEVRGTLSGCLSSLLAVWLDCSVNKSYNSTTRRKPSSLSFTESVLAASVASCREALFATFTIKIMAYQFRTPSTITSSKSDLSDLDLVGGIRDWLVRSIFSNCF